MLKAYYVRGDDLLAVMRPAGVGTWTSRFTHLDGLGSLRRLTDEAGNITDAWSYTAFGELYGRTGTDPIPYAFAGEPLDPNSGFQYHRARWMDPRTGLFTGMDPFEGTAELPATLHRYVYAEENPLNNSDPSGRTTLTTTLPAISYGSALRAISIVGLLAVACAVNASLSAAGAHPFEGSAPCTGGREFHRGRIQVQGSDLVKTWGSDTPPQLQFTWAQPTPMTAWAAGGAVIGLEWALNEKQRKVRDEAFSRVRALIWRSMLQGGIRAPFKQSYQNRRPVPPSARVDVEVIEGRAFTP